MIKLVKPMEILREIEKISGSNLYVVGSGIREHLFSNPVKRIRIMSVADPFIIAQAFSKASESPEISKKEDGSYEVSKDEEISFIFTLMEEDDIEAQLGRMIYSVDAVAMTVEDYIDFNESHIIDPYEGLEDIKSRILRLVRQENLIAKPIGYLRGIRLMAEHKLDIDPITELFMKENVEVLEGIKGEEYRKELFRILDQKESAYYINLMDRHIGMLKYIFPEIEPMKSVGECKYHVVDSFTHSVYTLKIAEKVINTEGFFERHIKKAYEEHMSEIMDSGIKRLSLLKLGAFFHDVGKPAAKFIDETGRTRFRGHEIVGAEILEKMGERLGLSQRETKILADYSKLHMFPLVIYKNNDVSGDTLYNMFSQTKRETLDILLIGYADIVSTRKLLDPEEEMGNFKVYIEYIANNYVTRCLPILDFESVLSYEELKTITKKEDVEDLYDTIKKEIYMGRLAMKKEKILEFIKKQNA
ncbi:poly(A) polymerase [Acetoanaerobium pronyense]|uniref:Poly(A) polymerase n=1 Tax=Acetoanaerobium pronyense TaxID=1482736 RepID=A0ABS4KJW7_9FIRM|nr:poly(A) polymerase [Acetoanaerobium pronyense]